MHTNRKYTFDLRGSSVPGYTGKFGHAVTPDMLIDESVPTLFELHLYDHADYDNTDFWEEDSVCVIS